jgi:hypothetical protein
MHNDLDGEGGRRSREHTDLLVETLDLGTLWEGYGIVGDIVVRFYSSIQTILLHTVLVPLSLICQWAACVICILVSTTHCSSMFFSAVTK